MAGLRNTSAGYGAVSRVLHWSTVGLVLMTLIVAGRFGDLPDGPERALTVATHASLGVAIAVLMLTRLGWRLRNPNPVRSYPLPAWRQGLAIAVHLGLYALVFVLAGSGLAQFGFAGEPVPVFDLVRFTMPLPADPALALAADAVHEAATRCLYGLVAVHVLGAIVHQVFAVE